MTRDARRRAAPLVLMIAGLVTTTAAFAADDTVFLKNGGRVRGTVIEEDPAKGVRIKLVDGTMRSLTTADVDHVQYAGASAPAPAPAVAVPGAVTPAAPLVPMAPAPMMPMVPFGGVGSLRVEASKPGRVFVDGGEVGVAPADVHDLAARRHRVRVDFDEGGSEERLVLITNNDTTKVVIEVSEARTIFNRTRKGAHLGVSAEPIFMYAYHSDTGEAFSGGSPQDFFSGSPSYAYGGGRITAALNVGLSPGADFRVGAFATEAFGAHGELAPFGGLVAFRFNIGSVYSMEFGLEGGYAAGTTLNFATHCTSESEIGNSSLPTTQICRAPVFQPGPFFGPEWSLASFRFGKLQQFEVELRQGLMIPVTDVAWYEQGLVFRYFFVSESAP